MNRNQLTEIYNRHCRLHTSSDFEVCSEEPCKTARAIENDFGFDEIWEFDDPFFKFEEWCKGNGFEDVVNCVPEMVDLERLHLAIEVYEKVQL